MSTQYSRSNFAIKRPRRSLRCEREDASVRMQACGCKHADMLAEANRFAPTSYHVAGYDEGGNSMLDRDRADEYNPNSFFGDSSAVT
eukprot:6187951-Pleurochrysis_carterae.AAC.3